MAEYIEREELIRQIICNMAEFIGAPDDVLKHDEQCNYAIFCVESAPVVDVAPVLHGLWMPVHESEMTGWDPNVAGRDPIGGYFCSKCHYEAVYDCNDEYVLSGYCPGCGARMDGADG